MNCNECSPFIGLSSSSNIGLSGGPPTILSHSWMPTPAQGQSPCWSPEARGEEGRPLIPAFPRPTWLPEKIQHCSFTFLNHFPTPLPRCSKCPIEVLINMIFNTSTCAFPFIHHMFILTHPSDPEPFPPPVQIFMSYHIL